MKKKVYNFIINISKYQNKLKVEYKIESIFKILKIKEM